MDLVNAGVALSVVVDVLDGEGLAGGADPLDGAGCTHHVAGTLERWVSS